MSKSILVTVKSGLSEEQVDQIADTIRGMDGVGEVSFVETAGSGDEGGLESSPSEGSGWPP